MYSTAHVALWTYVNPDYGNDGSLMYEIRVAELDSILLCSCLPMMPAFSKLVLRSMRRIFQVSDQSSSPYYQRFRGGEQTNLNQNILWLVTAKSWTGLINNRPVDGIDRTISIELSSEVRQARDLI